MVVIQYRLQAYAAAASVWDALPAGYYLLIRWWIALDVGAFAAVLGLFALMVFSARPVAGGVDQKRGRRQFTTSPFTCCSSESHQACPW